MDRIQIATMPRAAFLCTTALHALMLMLSGMLMPSDASAQVRTDAPDRGVYHSPRLDPSGHSQRPSRLIPAVPDEVSTDEHRGSPANENRNSIEDRRVELPRHVAADRDHVAADHDHVAAGRDVDGEPRSRYERSLDGLVDAGIGNNDSDRPAPSRRVSRQRRPRSTTPAQRSRQASNREAAAADRRSPTHTANPQLQQVSHDDVVLVAPHRAQHVVGSEQVIEEQPLWEDGGAVHLERAPMPAGPACDAASGGAISCDALSCDGLGCDSAGCNRCDPCGWSALTNGAICFSPDRWFGSAELLLMFRNGDHLPPLVTTGPASDPDSAGELGQAETRVLAGDEKQLDSVTAGGRLTIGTWLDDRQCRSLVLRGWMAGEETFGFHTDQNETPVIARPFFNVSDDQTPEQDTQLVALPGRNSGSIDIEADSNVYGGDVSVRQFWYGRYGATVDVLYGYQYMRLSEDLRISSTSTSLDGDFAPLGSVLSISDSFDTENAFHGGQLGIASHYREGCWSFDGLLKVGFGSLQREAERTGLTRTSVDAATSTTNEGLLVQSTNRGSTTDHTFGWIPELDVSLGWHRYPRFDVTCGYHIIAMTDALQVSGAIDPNLAVNLSDPPTGSQRPTAGLRYDTFYVHGIHFGLKYVY